MFGNAIGNSIVGQLKYDEAEKAKAQQQALISALKDPNARRIDDTGRQISGTRQVSPEENAGYTLTPAADRQGANNGNQYMIQPGDTLSGIAERNGYSVDQLAEYNGIEDPDRIDAGATLKFPTDTSSPKSFLNNVGDTLGEMLSKLRQDAIRGWGDLAQNAIDAKDWVMSWLGAGPSLTVPDGMRIATVDDPSQYEGKTFINQWGAQCVAYPQTAGSLPLTADWRPAELQLTPETAGLLPRGTVLGTFDKDGRYINDGTGHTMVVENSTPEGIEVWHQFVKNDGTYKPVFKEPISWNDPSGKYYRDLRNYSIVTVPNRMK